MKSTLIMFIDDHYLCVYKKKPQFKDGKVRWNCDGKFYDAIEVYTDDRPKVQQFYEELEKLGESSKEWALVLFTEDCILYACPGSYIKEVGSEISVRWTDGIFYSAKVIRYGTGMEIQSLSKFCTKIVLKSFRKQKARMKDKQKTGNENNEIPIVAESTVDQRETVTNDLLEMVPGESLFLDEQNTGIENNEIPIVAESTVDQCETVTNDLSEMVPGESLDRQDTGNKTYEMLINVENFEVGYDQGTYENFDDIYSDGKEGALQVGDKQGDCGKLDSIHSDSDSSTSEDAYSTDGDTEYVPSSDSLCHHEPMEYLMSDGSDDLNLEVARLYKEDPVIPYQALENGETLTQVHSSKIDVNDTTMPDLNANVSSDIFIPKKKYHKIKKRTTCKFCKVEVTNFERHVLRKHEQESEVQTVLLLPKKSKERRKLFGALRKQGEFQRYVTTKEIKLDKLVCVYCKGIYKRRYLRRHDCTVKKADRVLRAGNSGYEASISHTYMSQLNTQVQTLASIDLKTKVFSKMRVDEISTVAKKDPLIIAFGTQYMSDKTMSHLATVCSNLMRQLARILIEARKRLQKNEVDLSDLLYPEFYPIIVESARAIAGFDWETKTFKSPSLSAEVGRTLKKAVKTLRKNILVKNPLIPFENSDTRLTQLQQFLELVDDHWANDVAALARKNLATKKWIKPAILPLTKDVQKFRNYVISIAQKSVAKLKIDPIDKSTFRALTDAALVLTILYNRKRIGDVQYMTIQTYHTDFSTVNQQECLDSLTVSEKALTKHYKRVVTGGKLHRPVVTLFPTDIQQYIDVLLEIRLKHHLVPDSNKYLFAWPNSDRWIQANYVINKFAKDADLECPETIGSNVLRKQIATVMRVLNLSNEESREFAEFMGHTEKTHAEFYKLPQDVYQVAKISKILELMDKNKGAEFKGKSLQEIEIDPSVEPVEIETENEEECDDPEPITDNQNPGPSQNNVNNEFESESEGKPSKSKKAKSDRTPWTKKQKRVVETYFQKHIKNKIPPKKHEVLELKERVGSVLANKDWIKIKAFIFNSYAQPKGKAKC